MANLRDIRNRITSVNNTQQITKAMKMVAAAKLRKAQDRMNQNRPYAAKIQDVVARLAGNSSVDSPLMRSTDDPEQILIIVVGSDRGLCGGFNNNLFKEVELQIQSDFSTQQENGTLEMITIGKKASAYFPKRGYKVRESYPGFFDDFDYEKTSSIMNTARDWFVDEEYDQILIAYNEFKSVIAQNRKVVTVLPIKPEALVNDTEDVTDDSIDYIYEPDPAGILNKLLPLHLNVQLWKAILESNASEQGARMSAMDSATENAKELKRELKLKYNQARQSAITTEISEIVSGAQALSEN